MLAHWQVRLISCLKTAESKRGYHEMTEKEVVELKETLANLAGSLHTIASNLYGNPQYPDMDGDVKIIKDHLSKINGTLGQHDVKLNEHDVELSEVKKDVCHNSKVILSTKQWATVILVSVVGCGGGETLLDWVVKSMGW